MRFAGGWPPTWLCHVCGEERPDERISVASATFPIGRGISAAGQVNMRYCNDRPWCAVEAQAMADEAARRLARAGDPTQP